MSKDLQKDLDATARSLADAIGAEHRLLAERDTLRAEVAELRRLDVIRDQSASDFKAAIERLTQRLRIHGIDGMAPLDADLVCDVRRWRATLKRAEVAEAQVGARDSQIAALRSALTGLLASVQQHGLLDPKDAWVCDARAALSDTSEPASMHRIVDGKVERLAKVDTTRAELTQLRTEATSWATGLCSAHQTPDAGCRICNPVVAQLRIEWEKTAAERDNLRSLLATAAGSLAEREGDRARVVRLRDAFRWQSCAECDHLLVNEEEKWFCRAQDGAGGVFCDCKKDHRMPHRIRAALTETEPTP